MLPHLNYEASEIRDYVRLLEKVVSIKCYKEPIQTQLRRLKVKLKTICFDYHSHICEFFQAMLNGDHFEMDMLRSKKWHKNTQEYITCLRFSANYVASHKDLISSVLAEQYESTDKQVKLFSGWVDFFQRDDVFLEDELFDLLTKTFKKTDFRGPQLAIIKTIINQQDCLAFLPTGMGKSLLYQLPGS